MACPCCGASGACCVANVCNSRTSSACSNAGGIFRGTGTTCNICTTSFSACTVTLSVPAIGSVSVACSEIPPLFASVSKSIQALCGVLENPEPPAFGVPPEQVNMVNVATLTLTRESCAFATQLNRDCDSLNDTNQASYPYHILVTISRQDAFINNPVGQGRAQREWIYMPQFDQAASQWSAALQWTGNGYFNTIGSAISGAVCGTWLLASTPPAGYVAPASATLRCHSCGVVMRNAPSPGVYACDKRLLSFNVVSGSCCPDPFDHTLTISCAP